MTLHPCLENFKKMMDELKAPKGGCIKISGSYDEDVVKEITKPANKEMPKIKKEKEPLICGIMEKNKTKCKENRELNGDSEKVETEETANREEHLSFINRVGAFKIEDIYDVRAEEANTSDEKIDAVKIKNVYSVITEETDTFEEKFTPGKGIQSEQIYKCPTCPKHFTEKQKYSKHVYTHKLVQKLIPSHKCETCGKLFKMKHHLSRHLLCHNKQKPYKCASCEKSYVDKHDLIVHLSNNHVKTECNVCGVTVENRNALRKHLMKHKQSVSTVKDGYVTFLYCHICNKRYRNKRDLRNHLKLHAKMVPYTCEHCQKGFVFKSQLDDHLTKHTGKKPYECDVCKKVFSVKSNLVRHKKSCFSAQKTLLCRVCYDKIESDKYQEHKETCKLVFQCTLCTFVFNKRSNLKRHMKCHTKYLKSVDEETKIKIESDNVIVKMVQ